MHEARECISLETEESREVSSSWRVSEASPQICSTKLNNLKGTMLSEIRQTEQDKCCMITHVETQKAMLIGTENRLVVTTGEEMGIGEMSESDQKV